jgi:alpha-glucosidase
MSWWRDAVLYQIYPRSFADSDGDGVGDLRGIIGKLDHLAWVGVDAIWLSPVMASPNTDWGYDVSDYCAIHPELGSLDDFDELIAEAGRRNIRVLNDLVPNHTSDQHAWFVDARSSRGAAHRDWYVWADPKPDGAAPNNWISSFGGPAWTLDETTGQYYLHLFLPTQPDLNWWSEDVRRSFDEIVRFWFDRGVAGFRIDVCQAIVKDAELRDNPAASDVDPPQVRIFGQRHVFSGNRPEVHDVIKKWRRIAKRYRPERLLLGETYVWALDSLAAFYGVKNEELQLAFNIPFVFSRLDADAMHGIVDDVQRLFPRHAWPAWTGSNHDAGHLATRWARGDERRTRLALMMLLTLRGTPVLYYGDEIGMEDVPLELDDLRDPVGLRFYPAHPGRDPGRTPMQWTPGPGAGFTTEPARTWLPLGGYEKSNVADQRDERTSVLHLCRDLIGLRRDRYDIRRGAYKSRPVRNGLWVYRRGRRAAVALNMSDDAAPVRRLSGQVLISTSRDLDGQDVRGSFSLPAWEGVVVELRG